MSRPKLSDISWQVSEPEYREDPALSYSTLSRFAREGFDKLDSIFDKIDTPSLTFGSAVDALITGGQEEFDNNFMVAAFPPIGDAVLRMVRTLFSTYKEQYRTITSIPDSTIIELSEELKYQLNWKPETRAKVIKEQGNEYYSLLYAAGKRTILDLATNEQVNASVRALKESDATKFYFADNNIFDDGIVREYQLKFKATLEGVDYRCMADLILVDHNTKTIYPIDLKTSSHTEWSFYQSFIQWRYDIQGRLYWRIIRANLDKDPFWKEYTLADYTFVVVNRWTLTPLAWEFKDTKAMGVLKYGKHQQIELEDPYTLGKSLHHYLSSRPAVPSGIIVNGKNDIKDWLNSI